VEALSGYDLLALLPDDVEGAVESNTQPPFAALTGPTVLNEGDSATFSASGSLDPNGTLVSYAWTFGDGATATGVSPSHAFAQDGVYSVTVTVTDNDGLTSTAAQSVTVANVPPVVSPIANASLDAGDAHTVTGTFTDPGADAWTATVDWGDGSSPGQAMLSSHDFSLVHVYPDAGTYTVTVNIADDDASGVTTQTVTVNEVSLPDAELDAAFPLIDQLVARRKISRDFGNFLKGQVNEAQDHLDRGNTNAAVMWLRVIVGELDLLVRFRQLTPADAAPLRTLFLQVIEAQPTQFNRFAHKHRHRHHH
jgi:PKD repeat protein